jgi:hypothetical protein
MPRDRGGSIQLTEGTGGIRALCPCEHFLEVYKIDTTFRIETPETIDPDRTNPHAPMVAVVADRIGCAHPIVARVLLQGRDILELAILRSSVDRGAVVGSLHSIKEALVACHKATEFLSQHVAAAEATWAASQVSNPGGQRVIPSLPQVPDLEPTATQFLIAAKRAIAAICGLVPHFLLVERSDNNFDHLGQRLEALLGGTAPLTTFLREYSETSRYLIDLRNGQEHPKPERATYIQNFRVQPDGAVAVPVWFVTGAAPRPIHVETAAAVERLIEMAELMLIHLVHECLDARWPFVIQELEPSERDSTMPIRYKLNLDMSRLRRAE